MKAIEILFNRIDELNTKIKLEKDIEMKVRISQEIGQITKIIKEMEILKNAWCPSEFTPIPVLPTSSGDYI